MREDEPGPQPHHAPHLLDEKLTSREVGLWNYAWQCLAATLVVFGILLVFNVYTEIVVIAALGSTVFTLFAMPSQVTAQPRNVIGGHVVGLLVGGLCYAILVHAPQAILGSGLLLLFLIAGSIGLSTFVMVLTDTEHPPAAGTALFMVMAGWSLANVLPLILLVVALVGATQLLKPWMRDLV